MWRVFNWYPDSRTYREVSWRRSHLPAQIIGLTDRGYLRAGTKADVVVFDFDKAQDRATILEPDLYPEGIEHVLVNGEFTVDGGSRTGALPGAVLRRVDTGRSEATSQQSNP